jgi:cytochrome c biogenesis protein CcmG/thiol:disulfide interchange protein DsbE
MRYCRKREDPVINSLHQARQGLVMPWRRLAITLLIIAPILALLAFGFTRDSRYIVSPLIAKPATPFTVTTFNGDKLTLNDLRGKAVFLNFWASWCLPCRAEARDLETAWQKVKDKNMVFLGVALQDTDKNSLEFLKEFNVTYPNGKDESGKIGVDYGTWGIPESFFIDPKGRITYKHVGGIRAALVIAKLEEATKGIVSAQEGRGDYQGVK